MNTHQKGEIARIHVLLRAAEQGWAVSIPTAPARYDLIIDYGGRLERAQVKWGGAKSRRSENAVQIELRSDTHSGRSLVYRDGEVDCLLVYIPDFGIVRLPPEKFVGKTAVVIRLEAPKNNQKNVTLAKDFRW